MIGPRALTPGQRPGSLLALLALLLALGITACGGGQEPAAPGSAPRPAVALGPAGVPAGTIELRRWREPAERVVIDVGGVALGPMQGPLTRYLFVLPERSRDLGFFLLTYAPFRTAAGNGRGELAFGGRGKTVAGPAEQRMILEWARLVSAEAAGSRSGVAYGLVLAWHRGGSVGDCDDLVVYLSGEVRASACAWARDVRGRLSPEPLARIYDWFDRLAPFQAGGEEGTGTGREESRLVFAGQGSREATPQEILEIRALAPPLFRELAARRAPSPGTQTPVPDEPAGHLLLPPDTVAAGPPPAAIPPDLEPPPVPESTESTPPP